MVDWVLGVRQDEARSGTDYQMLPGGVVSWQVVCQERADEPEPAGRCPQVEALRQVHLLTVLRVSERQWERSAARKRAWLPSTARQRA
jgi:hypothetical protein